MGKGRGGERRAKNFLAEAAERPGHPSPAVNMEIHISCMEILKAARRGRQELFDVATSKERGGGREREAEKEERKRGEEREGRESNSEHLYLDNLKL